VFAKKFATGAFSSLLGRIGLRNANRYQFAVGDTDHERRDGIRGAAGVRHTW
jgi:hypothetical protein